jgi:transcriptional regulator with XRE-family HTH domain
MTNANTAGPSSVNAESANAARYLLIRQRLLARGSRMAQLSRRLHVSKAAVTLVAQGKRVSRRIRGGLARACGMTVKEMWG